MKKDLARLSECETRVSLRLEALVAACFPGCPAEDFAAARGAGVSFVAASLPEQLGSTLVAVGSAGARTAASVASRVGASVTAQAFSVLGAVVSSGDFVHSMLTQSPNRKTLQQVAAFLEAKSEAYRIWLVLIDHWVALPRAGAHGREAHSPPRAIPQLVPPAAGWSGGGCQVRLTLRTGAEMRVAAELQVLVHALPIDVVGGADGVSDTAAGDSADAGDEVEPVLAERRLQAAVMQAVAAPLEARQDGELAVLW